jgi:hypothetical protein
MDILAKARKLESNIARRLDSAARELVRSGTREPLEIVHALVESVEQEVQPGGRGNRVFPFNSIRLSVLAPSREARARFEAIFAGEPSLRERIVERLRSAGCHAPEVALDINFVGRAQKDWRDPEFHVQFARVAHAEADDHAPDSKPARIEMTVLSGVAVQRNYCFASRRIHLGRCAEVRDSHRRLIRANQVAFAEGSDDINQSVSRQHAHIAYEPGSGEFRLHDDGSVHGTGIVRDGRTLAVPRGARGVRLQSGDEVVLGEARLRIKIDKEASRRPHEPSRP